MIRAVHCLATKHMDTNWYWLPENRLFYNVIIRLHTYISVQLLAQWIKTDQNHIFNTTNNAIVTFNGLSNGE